MSETSVYITNSEMTDYVATTLSVWEATLKEEFKPSPSPTPSGGVFQIPEITLLNRGEAMQADTCYTYNGLAGLFASFTGGASPVDYNEHFPWQLHSVRYPSITAFGIRPAGYYFDLQGYNFKWWSGILNGSMGDVKLVPITSDFIAAPDTYTWASYSTDFNNTTITPGQPSGFVPTTQGYPLLVPNNADKVLEVTKYIGLTVSQRTEVKGLAIAARIGSGSVVSTTPTNDVYIIGYIKFPEDTALLTKTYAAYDLKLTQKYPYALFPEPYYSKIIEYGNT